VAQVLVARGRFRVSADTPDQVELFQGVARRVSDMLQRPVASYANGREIVITFGQQEAPALALRSPGWAFPARQSPRPAAYELGEDKLYEHVKPRKTRARFLDSCRYLPDCGGAFFSCYSAVGVIVFSLSSLSSRVSSLWYQLPRLAPAA